MEYPQGTQGWRKYKVSEQNNYRRTANCVAESFLGYSLFDFASRVPPTDDPDGESHPARLTDCQSCHNHIEELASFFTDFNERGYYMPGFGHPFVSIPVEDGLGPGFLGEPMPAGTDAPLRWLAEQVAAHPRFATTMSRRLLFPLLMGRAVESPPRQIATPEDLVLARVRRVDEAVAEDVAVVLMDEGYQVAPALAHLAKSRLFRAEGVEPDVEPAVAEILSASGSAAVVPPSTLHRFIDAVFGEPWLAPYKNQAWVPGLVDFRLDWRTLAGGLDGWSVTARPRDTVTALTSSALEHVAFSMACAVVPAQVADAGATQTLLPFVDRGDAPGDTAFDDNLAYLYRRFTSRELGTEEQLEMEHLYASAAATSGPACGLDDPAVRGWVAVVVYLFTHANTLIR